jgi:ABC-2 type transport system ATP-binding protein
MIELDSVTKYYGNFPAVTDISFRVEKGEVLGFLGPNGAGKSTTMKMITGFTPPSKGTCTVAGFDIVEQSLEARRLIGYLPETVPLYTDMSVEDYLGFMGRIRGMSSRQVNRRIDDVIDICRLQEYFTTYIHKLSKGFRQRVGIAQAILHEPEVLILDEPTIGIDPIQVVETRELIRDLGGDRTVIVSTHILPEVSALCERVIIIHEGQIVAIDKPENLAIRLRGVERIEMDVQGPTRDIVAAMQRVDLVTAVHRKPPTADEKFGSYEVEAEQGADVRADLAAVVVKGGWSLLKLESVGMSLEEIFLRLTTSEQAAEPPNAAAMRGASTNGAEKN